MKKILSLLFFLTSLPLWGQDLVIDSATIESGPYSPGGPMPVPVTIILRNLDTINPVPGGQGIVITATVADFAANGDDVNFEAVAINAPIAEGGTHEVILNIPIPAGQEGGTYSISLVEVESFVGETNAANNTLEDAGSFVVEEFGDLVIREVSIPEGPFIPGDVVDIEVTVENIARVTAIPAGSGIIVRAVIAGMDPLESAPINSAIAAGETAPAVITVAITQAQANGPLAITSLEVDPDDVVDELNEGNNTLNNPGAIAVEAYADLTIDEIEFLGEPYYPGSTFSVRVIYSNVGERNAGAFQILADVIAPATGEGFSITGNAPGLAAEAAGSITLTGVIPLDNPNGTYEVIVTLDSLSVVIESDKSNNTSETTFDIDTLPDLQIDYVNYEPGAWQAGDPVEFSLRYRNNASFGDQRTKRVENTVDERYRIEVVLSTDTEFGNEDDFLLFRRDISGNPDIGGNLLPYQGTADPDDIAHLIEFSWLQAMPRNYYGDYFILAKIDVLENVEEFVEDNREENGNNVWFDPETAKITLLPTPEPQPVTWRASVDSTGAEGEFLSEEPHLSEDGRWLVFSSLSQLAEEDTNSNYDIYLRDNHTGEVHLVSRGLSVTANGDSRKPFISANGEYVVFHSEASNLTGADTNGLSDVFLYEVATSAITRVSRSVTGGAANGASVTASVSADGEWVVFASEARNLVDGGTASGRSHIYSYERSTASTRLISLADGGGQANGRSTQPKISANGAFVTFVSTATDIVPGVIVPGVAGQQVYRVDTDGSDAYLVSAAGLGVGGNGNSFSPDISADGSVVVFSSHATDFVVGDTNGIADVFIREIGLDTTTRIVASDSDQLNIASNLFPGDSDTGALDPVISADGRYVAFRTQSDNLLAETVTRSDGESFGPGAILGYSDLNSTHPYNANAVSDIYLYDRSAPDDLRLRLVSVNRFGYQGWVAIFDNEAAVPSVRQPAISGDGRYIAFAGDGRSYDGFDHLRTNLLSNDTNLVRDVFIHDRRTNDGYALAFPPTVEIEGDLNGTTMETGTTLILEADASDLNGGFVESVEFYLNGVLHGIADTRGDFFTQWTPQIPGVYVWVAVATDNDGIRAESEPVVITVNDSGAPTVTLITPKDGDTYFTGSEISLHALAGTAGPSIVSVEFFADGESLGVDTQPPYTTEWSASQDLGPGTYILSAIVTDSIGKKGISGANTITIADPAIPTVEVSAPSKIDVDGPGGVADGIADVILVAGRMVTFEASVLSSGAQIEEVIFSVNGQVIDNAEMQNGVWKLDYTPGSLGFLQVRASARDSSGNLHSSSVVTYQVQKGDAPDIVWDSPTFVDVNTNDIADALLQQGETVILVVEATDDDGFIGNVEFSVNGVLIGQGEEKSAVDHYEIEFTPQLQGLHTFTVIATDNDGNETQISRTFDVSAGQPPSVSITQPAPAVDTLPVGAPAVLVARVEEEDATVERVEVRINGQLVGVAFENTRLLDFEYTFTPELLGNYTVRFTAFDTHGNQGWVEKTYTVTTGNAPQAEVLFPSDADNDEIADDLFSVSVPIAFLVEAVDSDGVVESVEFFINNVNIGEASPGAVSGQYSLTYTPMNVGIYTFLARVRDNAGNTTETDPLSVEVVAGMPPLVELVAPISTDANADGIADVILPRGQQMTLAATASDSDGVIVAVRFFANGQLIGNGIFDAVDNRYELNYTPVAFGLLDITVEAQDDDGIVAGDAVQYMITNGLPPAIVFENPEDDGDGNGEADSTLQWNQPTELAVRVSDNDGWIESVRFIINRRTALTAQERGEVGRYAVDFTPLLSGLHRVEVIAADERGNETSRVLRVNVIRGAPPVVTIVSPPADVSYLPGTTLPVQVNAYDPDGLIVEVRYYLNGVLGGIGSKAPWRAEISLPSGGTYTMEAEALDNSGNIIRSAPRTINVSMPDAVTPRIIMTHPLALGGADAVNDVSEASAMFFNAEVGYVEAGRQVERVGFYINGQYIGDAGQQLGNIYSHYFQPNAPGNYVIVAEVEDDMGRIGHSFPMLLDVGPLESPMPTAVILDSFPYSEFNKPIELFAEVDGGLNDITRVDLFANGVLVASTEETAPDGSYRFVWTPPEPGNYNFNVRCVQLFTSSFDNWEISPAINIDVLPPPVSTPPSVGITYPADGAQVTSASKVMVLAGAADTDGNIEQVRFYVNNQLMHTDVTLPYSYSWTPGEQGYYELIAEATDNTGDVSISQRVTVNAIPAAGAVPDVEIVSPPRNVSYLPGTLLPAQVNAYVADGLVVEVRFYLNGVLVGATDKAPWRMDISLPSPGAYSLVAEAIDSHGNVVHTEPHEINVSTPDEVTPRMVMTHPLPLGGGDSVNDVSVASAMFFNVRATALGGGSIERVTFFINGQSIGNAENNLNDIYSTFFEPNAPGSYVIFAEAEDDAGRIGHSVPMLLDVGPLESPMPTAVMLEPFARTEVLKPIELFARVDGGLNGVDRVDFFANGVLLGSTEETAPDGAYRFVWIPPAPGDYTLNVRGIQIDPNGMFWDNWTISDGVSLEVMPIPVSTPPTVVITHPLDGTDVSSSSEVLVLAGAADTDGNVEEVRFYVNNQLLHTDTTFPYTYSWTPGEQGEYELVAEAIDNLDDFSISQRISVLVQPAAGYVPDVVLSSPSGTLSANTSAVLAIRAEDPEGLIDVVDFYVNHTFVGAGAKTVVPGVWAMDWQPQATGDITVFATVRDTLGNLTHVEGTFTVTETGAPVINAILPEPVESLLYNQTHTLEILTTAATGRVVNTVTVFIDDEEVGQAVESAQKGRFLFDWRPSLTGTYSIEIEVLDNVGRISRASANYQVVAGEAPVVNLLSPLGITPTAGSDVLIEAGASDTDGFVDHVEFYVNQILVGTDETSPFSTFWRPGSAGTYVLEVRAIDNNNNTSSVFSSVQVSSPVGNVPSISLSVTESGNVTPGSRVMVRAIVNDDNPELVTFFLNGVQVGQDPTAPYTILLDPKEGSVPNRYEIVAVVTDADGNSRSTQQLFYISDIPVDQPEIAIISPMDGATFTYGSRTSLRVNVSGGAASFIEGVVFYANGKEIGRDDAEPYQLDWIPDVEGDVQITAATLLNKRSYVGFADVVFTPVNVALPVNVSVEQAVGDLPSISLVVLPDIANVAIGSRIMLYADVQDTDGNAEELSVTFFLDGSPLATISEPPFAHRWLTMAEGRYFLSASVSDADGNVVSSGFSNVDVASRVVTVLPQVSLTTPSSGQEGSLMTLRSSVQGFVNGPEAVVFYVNGEPVGSVSQTPYNLQWLTTVSGDTTFFATARRVLEDGTVMTAVSEVDRLYLIPNDPPVINSFTYTFPGQSVITKPDPLLGETIRFTVEVSDTGPIERVELLRNGESIGTSSNAASPYEITDTPGSLGLYRYNIVVTDKAGVQAQAVQPLNISVTQGKKPSVSVTSPLAGDESLPGRAVRLRAVASDVDGFVTAVQFFVNGQPVGGPLTSSPYETNYTPNSSGNYVVTARATDNSGNVSLSGAVAFTVLVDNPPYFTAFGHDLPGSFARLNQPIRWTFDAEDDNGVVRVQLFRNSQPVESPGGVEIPIEVSDVPPNTGKFTYFAEAMDSGGNITRSSSIEITVTRGTAPNVSIISPVSPIESRVGVPLEIRANASPAAEAAGVPTGSVTKVEFFANSQSFGVVTSAPYIGTFTPTADALYLITAVATSDTGLTRTSLVLQLQGIDGNVPEILTFTNNTTNNQSLTGVPINFTVTATDERGISRVELIQDNMLAATAFADPFRFTVTLVDPGNYVFRARATNLDGNSATTAEVTITVRTPDPLEEDGDFVYQSFLDLLFRSPTAQEQSSYASRLESGDLSRDRFIRELLEFAEFNDVRNVLTTSRLMLAEWPTRSEIEYDMRVLRDAGIQALVENHLNAFTNRYLAEVNQDPVLRLATPITALPGFGTPVAEISSFVRYLFRERYGVLPGSGQLAFLRDQRFIHRAWADSDAVVFLSEWVRDNFIERSSEFYRSTLLRIEFPLNNPPDQAIRLQAEAAALLVNMLRIMPSDEEIAEFSLLSSVSQTDQILNDERYNRRFGTADPDLQQTSDFWLHSSWFGSYRNANGAIRYHADWGWLQFEMAGQTADDFWFYDYHMGWNWTQADVYPLFYNANTDSWMLLDTESCSALDQPTAERVIYDYRQRAWVQR